MALLRSVKFNIALFVLIAVSAAVGTIIPQREPLETYLHSYGPRWAALLQTLGVFDLYHAWWFAGLLGLLGVNVMVCKLRRRPPDPGLLPLPEQGVHLEGTTTEALLRKPYGMSGILPMPVDAVARQARLWMQGRRYAVGQQRMNGQVFLWAARHRLQRWGSYIAHVSLVVILLGGVVKSLLGFETFLPVLEGREAGVVQDLLNDADAREQAWHDTPGRAVNAWLLHAPGHLQSRLKRWTLRRLHGWRLGVDRFTVDFYPQSATPVTFASQIRLLDGDRLMVARTIRVNEPLDWQHVRFYQASWGVTGMLRSVTLERHGRPYQLAMGGTLAFPDHPWRMRVEHLLPDFTIDAAGRPTTKSLEWNRPGVVLRLLDRSEQVMGTLVLGAPTPHQASQAQDWAFLFQGGQHLPIRPPVNVLGIDPVLFSGIEVGYDPGFPIIVVGVLVFLFGLSALFYLHQRRVWVLLAPQGGGTTVTIGGWSSRPSGTFQREFATLVHAVLGGAHEGVTSGVGLSSAPTGLDGLAAGLRLGPNSSASPSPIRQAQGSGSASSDSGDPDDPSGQRRQAKSLQPGATPLVPNSVASQPTPGSPEEVKR